MVLCVLILFEFERYFHTLFVDHVYAVQIKTQIFESGCFGVKLKGDINQDGVVRYGAPTDEKV